MRILVTALLACAALPAAADAATVSRTGGTLRYEAGKGERISWEITETSGGVFLTRVAKRVHQRLIPGAGCKRSGAREIRCAGQGVLGARLIGRKGVVRARIDCTDPRGCVTQGLLLKRRGHEASINRIRVIKIPFGESRTASARILPEIWKRRRHGRSLRVKLEPVAQVTRSESAAGPIGSYPRALTLRISR